MATQQYTVDADNRSNGDAFVVPGDEPGDTASFQSDQDREQYRMAVYAHIANGFDVDCDVTLEGSHAYDESLADAVPDGASETISADDAAAFDSTVGHSYIQIRVDPASTPSSGELTITISAREQ